MTIQYDVLLLPMCVIGRRLKNLMRSQTTSTAHAKVAWEHRNSNVDFWTDEEIVKFNIKARSCEDACPPCSAQADDENEIDISHAESQMMNINDALMTHDTKHAASWRMLRETWQWIEGMSGHGEDVLQPQLPSDPNGVPVIMQASGHHLPLAEVGSAWNLVMPIKENMLEEEVTENCSQHNGSLPRDEPIAQLRPDQQRVKDHICGTNKQTLVFVLAGGGVGKTVMINALDKHFGEGGQINFAYTGAAAALLPNGRTLTRLFGMKEQDSHIKELVSLVAQARHIVIDEVSMCPLHILLCMNSRLQKVLGNSLPFGGLKVTLVGDFCQLPVIGQSGSNIFDERKWPPFFGAMLETFEYFTDSDFGGNKRSDGCLLQKTLTEKMRQMPPFMPGGNTVRPGVNSWSEEEKEMFNPMDENTVDTLLTELTDVELIEGFSKLPCHLFCRTNSAKAAYNMKLVERLSAETGKPCFIYRRPIVSDHTQLDACDSILYEPDRFPELFGVFMEGAPCVLLCNANVSLGLVNGATGTMHKLHWKEAADNVEWSAKMANAVPGKLFPIKEPSLIFMKMDHHKDEAFWEKRLSTFPPERNVCDPEPRRLRSDPVVKKEIIVGIGHCTTQPPWAHVIFGKEKFKFKAHNVELALAVTPWKSQGRAYARAMLDMSNSFGGTAIPLEMIYVAYTRVPNLRSIRCLPLRNVQQLRKHLLNSRMNFWATRFRCRAEIKSKARRDAQTLTAQSQINHVLPPAVHLPPATSAMPSANTALNQGSDAIDEAVQKWCKKWMLIGETTCDGANVTVSWTRNKIMATALSNAHRECCLTKEKTGPEQLIAVLRRLDLKPEKMPSNPRKILVRVTLHVNAVLPPRVVTCAGATLKHGKAPLQCMLSLQLVPSVANGADMTTASRWVKHLESKTKTGGLSRIDGFPEPMIPPELRVMPLAEGDCAQRQMRLVACARTVITLLMSTSSKNAIAVMTVRCGSKKRIVLEKMASQCTWDVDTGNNVPTTVVVLVEGICQVQNAAKELPLNSLQSNWGHGSMRLTAVTSPATNGSDATAQCFASGRWWEFDGKHARTIGKPRTLDGHCFFYQRVSETPAQNTQHPTSEETNM